MLHYSTVEPSTLSLLKRLMLLKELSTCSLVGDTALSLKLGHRKSIDIDLFSIERLAIDELIKALLNEFKTDFVYEKQQTKCGLFCYIQNVKVDIIHYPHPLLKPIEVIDNVKFYSEIDIAAMKINAILGRGVKKDFFDLVELLKHFNLEEIINAYQHKYPNQHYLISIPNSLIYFDDAEDSPNPLSLNNTSWDEVKITLKTKVRNYLR